MQIEDPSFDFAKQIVKFYQYLTKDTPNKEYILSKQVRRYGTSIGANVSEAQHAKLKADLISR